MNQVAIEWNVVVYEIIVCNTDGTHQIRFSSFITMKPLYSLKLVPSGGLVELQLGGTGKCQPTELKCLVRRTH